MCRYHRISAHVPFVIRTAQSVQALKCRWPGSVLSGCDRYGTSITVRVIPTVLPQASLPSRLICGPCAAARKVHHKF
jgi:hypothetical protein